MVFSAPAKLNFEDGGIALFRGGKLASLDNQL
jgi:hypothetical protein